MHGAAASIAGTHDVERAARVHHVDGGSCADAAVDLSAAEPIDGTDAVERAQLGMRARSVALGASTHRHPAPHGDRELHIDPGAGP